MTFEKMTISPSPGLNLIIGPNGSGKSTIVCAIGLGLGASPNVLARTNKIAGFIRHSCDEAKIKILLTANPSFWVCRRITTDNSTQWRIRVQGGKWKQTSSADVLQRIQALHIQLDNLCMFLPQERVKEFSTLKPNQLLVATEQAINKEAHESHKSLIRDFQTHRDTAQKVKDLQNNLAKYQSAIDQMQGDVVRLRQVEECKENIEKYEKKIPWVQYQVERDELHSLKKALRAEVKLYKEAKESIAPLQQQINNLTKQKGSSSKAKEKFGNAKATITKLSAERFQTENKLQSIKNKIEQAKKNRDELVAKIDKLNVVLEHTTARSQSADAQSYDELHQQRRELSKELQDVQVNDTEVKSRMQTVEREIKRKTQKIKDLQSRIQKYENQKSRLLDHIGQRMHRADVIHVYKYIKEHRSNFVGQIYGPICAEVRFDDPRNSHILQMVLENHILFSFLVEDQNDFDHLMNYLHQKDLTQITVLHAGDQNVTRSQRPPPPDLTRYGFSKYVDQLFQAPEAVKKMLINIGSLDLIPVGSGQTAQNSINELTNRVFPQARITRYFVDNLYYLIYKSRSGGKMTVISTPIRNSSIWRDITSSDDDVKQLVEKCKSIESKIENMKVNFNQIKAEGKQYQEQSVQITSKLKAIKEKISERASLDQKLKQIKDKIKLLTKELNHQPNKEKEYPKQLEDLVKHKQKIDIDTIKAFTSIIEAQKEIDKITSKEQYINSQLLELQEKLEEEKQRYASQERRILELNDQKTQKKNLVDKIQHEAEKKCPLTEENKKMMTELPADLDVLNAELARFKARYASLSHIDPTIAARFAEAEKNRDKTKEQLDTLLKQSETMTIQLERRFNDWKQLVSKDVGKINSAFQELMTTCEYRGEVQLDSDDKDRIETYKLNILVAFNRTSNLNVLSSTRQSGGEKSVTTLLYLLALQDCTMFPFRVVDEINQGMDEVNDRNTFFQVMSYAMRRNQASQYFLVTPKLLPQLDLMDGVTVLVVMNGPYIEDDLTKPITFESALQHASSQ